MKKKISKQRTLIASIAFLTMTMCVSIGFASWIVTGGTTAFALGLFNADEFATNSVGEIPCFSNLSLTNVFSFSSYGFLKNDSSFSKASSTQVDIDGQATFVPEPAFSNHLLPSLDSNQANSKFKMTITIRGTSSLANKLIGNSASIIWSNNTINGTINTTAESENISASFAITNVKVAENTSFTFKFKVSSPNFDSFYTDFSPSGKGFTVSVKAEELKN